MGTYLVGYPRKALGENSQFSRQSYRPDTCAYVKVGMYTKFNCLLVIQVGLEHKLKYT